MPIPAKLKLICEPAHALESGCLLLLADKLLRPTTSPSVDPEGTSNALNIAVTVASPDRWRKDCPGSCRTKQAMADAAALVLPDT